MADEATDKAAQVAGVMSIGGLELGLTEAMGYAAAGLVLAAFSVRSITTLRALAIASNLLFIAYAWSAALPPVLILHALLLPLNVFRLWEEMPPVAPCFKAREAPRTDQ